MAPRRTKVVETEEGVFVTSPESIADIVADAEQESVGIDALHALLVNLGREFGDDELVITLHVKKPNASTWSQLDTYRERIIKFDSEELVNRVLANHGPGDYKFILRHKGRVLKHIEFALGDPRQKNTPVAVAGPSANQDMLLMMFQQMNENARADREQAREDARRRDAQMQTVLSTAITAIGAALPLVFREKTPPIDETTKLANLAQVMKQLQPEQAKANPLKETIDVITSVKGLLGGAEPAGPPDIMSSAMGMLPQFLDLASKGAASPTPVTAREVPIPPKPRPAIQQKRTHPAEADPVLRHMYRIIAMCVKEGFDHDLTAEMLAAKLIKEGITQDDIQSLATRIYVSGQGDPLTGLKHYGIDLTEQKEWAEAVLAAVASIYNETINERNDTGGQAGNAGNSQNNENTSQTGESEPQSEGNSSNRNKKSSSERLSSGSLLPTEVLPR